MIQALRTRDVLRCILLNVPNGPNLACPSQCVTGGKPASNPILWKETLAQRRERVTVASWDGTRLAGLASARIRSGHRAWEIDRLFLAGDAGDGSTGATLVSNAPVDPAEECLYTNANPDSSPNTVALELLDQIARETGQLKAQRIFLRLPANSRIFTLARQAGYFPYYEETLLDSGVPVEPQPLAPPPENWRELTPEDYYSLFQLYCSATPQPVRTGVGMTFDQWHDAQESTGHRQTWVSKTDGRVLARLALSWRGRVMGGEVLVDPGDPGLWAAPVEWALNQGGIQRWLVPDYQEMVSSLLLSRHFRAVSRYSVMIKTVTVPVAKLGMVTVEA